MNSPASPKIHLWEPFSVAQHKKGVFSGFWFDANWLDFITSGFSGHFAPNNSADGSSCIYLCYLCSLLSSLSFPSSKNAASCCRAAITWLIFFFSFLCPRIYKQDVVLQTDCLNDDAFRDFILSRRNKQWDLIGQKNPSFSAHHVDSLAVFLFFFFLQDQNKSYACLFLS